MITRGIALSATAALALTLVSTAPALASTTTIGAASRISAGTAPTTGTKPGNVVQVAAADGSFAVPAAGGVITSFLHRGGSTAGDLTLKVYRPAATAGSYTVLASQTRAVTPATTLSVPVRIPVQQGDLLGVSSQTVDLAYLTSNTGDVLGFFPTDPAVGETATAMTQPGYVLDIAAVVESDADKDGYGDDTQDKCATDARTQAPCPETTLTKRPKKVVKTTKRKAKATIGFSQPDSAGTFLCSVDGKAATACTSPFTKKYKLGKHTVQVTAVNSAGVADLTPVVVTFKVKRKR